jgi:hypothetical protein
MLFDIHFPLQFSADCIECINVALEIAEEHRVAAGRCAFQLCDERRRAHTGIRIEAPMHAAGLRIQRIHAAARTGQKQPSTDQGGLAIAATGIGH